MSDPRFLPIMAIKYIYKPNGIVSIGGKGEGITLAGV